jgi:hypothetical protein
MEFLRTFTELCDSVITTLFPMSKDLCDEGLDAEEASQINYRRMRVALTKHAHSFSTGELTEQQWASKVRREYNLFHRNSLYFDFRETMRDATLSIVYGIPNRIQEIVKLHVHARMAETYQIMMTAIYLPPP